MSPRVSDLLAGLAPSATLAVDAKAKALKAAGEPVIGYGAGEPDFPTPAHIVEAAIKACQDPANYKYTPTAGLPLLREAIAAKTLRDSGLTIPASQILVTNGGKHAVATTFMTLVNPGDENGLAAAMEQLAASPDLRKRLGAAALDLAHRELSFDRKMDLLLASYRKAIG